MNVNYRMLFYTVLVLVNMVFTGCFNYNRLKAPQKPNTRQQQYQLQHSKDQNNTEQIKEKVILDVPIIPQKPQLGSGCEVTSLTMVLQYAGVKIDKMALAQKIKKDTTPLIMDKNGNIIKWGNPNDGFVGDITGKDKGFAVYPKPLIELMEQYLPNRSVDLTDQPFDTLIRTVSEDRPVIVWVTIDFKQPDSYEKWEKDEKTIKGTFDEHAVVLVGYDKDNCYINNPYNGKKNQKVRNDTFKSIWDTMGNMAVSYK